MGKDRGKKVIGILTGGGDCPGLNAVIRAVVKTAINEHKMDVIGIMDGYAGLVEGRSRPLSFDDASGILTQGGTILGTSNIANPFRYYEKGAIQPKDLSQRAFSYYKELDLEAIVCVGGDGTLTIAHKLQGSGLNIVGIPKTIDNDIMGTDQSFGFDSALITATDAIDKLHTTAQSHHRVMIVEVMGRYAGWLALLSGVAGGGDVILIPEIPYDIEKICHEVLRRSKYGKRFSIVVIAEGAKAIGEEFAIKEIIKGSADPIRLGGISNRLRSDIAKRTELETRAAILGYLQRGGTPTPFDRILATRFGTKAVQLVVDKEFGEMVALKGQDIVSVNLDEVAGKTRKVPLESPIIAAARSIGTCFGD